MIRASNAFQRLNVFLRDDLAFSPEIFDRTGMPDLGPSASEQLLSEIVTTFSLDSSLVPDIYHQGNLATQYTVPWLNIPLQAVTQQICGVILPFAVTFEVAKPDRSGRRVLIWWANTYTGRWLKWASECLEAGGWKVTFADLHNVAVNDFVAAYEGNEFDVIWLSGHGNWNPYEFHRSAFSVTENDQPNLSWWAALSHPRNDRRRLLILDMCDSGTTAVMDGLLELGLPPLLTTASQAVVGNLWPVDAEGAAVFSVLLACQLGDGEGYFSAYTKALKILSSGKSGIRTELAQKFRATHSILDALDRSSADFASFGVWGAPAFFA